MSKIATIRCAHCKKQVRINLPEHKKGERQTNIIKQINDRLPAGWTVSSLEYRCEKCS